MTIVATADTRNAAWASDTSAFGHRMLRKMGWTEGKGLGKKEDGTATNLRAVRRAEETLGIGAEIDTFGSSAWGHNKNNFQTVLATLKATHSTTTSTTTTTTVSRGSKSANGKERKKKSKKTSTTKTTTESSTTKSLILAQNKVTAGHAAKMRRAKDLSTKSHEDMAAVFGMRVAEFQQQPFVFGSLSALHVPRDDEEDSKEKSEKNSSSSSTSEEQKEKRKKKKKRTREGKETSDSMTAQEMRNDEVSSSPKKKKKKRKSNSE